jgi:tripartite-type tricarboxylate transporter receptor subunit TctC
VLGTKFRVIEGYKGITEAAIAIERGEVGGVCTSWAQFNSYQHLIRDGKFRVLLHLELTALADMPPGVPSVYSFAKIDEQRQFLHFVFSSTEFGRPYVFPPEVPPDRVALMRKAFVDVAKDPQMLAEAEKAKIDMTYIAPARLEELVENLYKTPPDLIEAVKRLVPNLQ